MATPTTTIRLPTELREQVESYAKARHETNTEVIVRALREYFERQMGETQRDAIRRELRRLADIDGADPEFSDFYGGPEEDPFPRVES